MSDDHDDASKTEEPSHKKLEDARKKGNIVSTRELNHFFMMLAMIFFITSMAPGMGKDTTDLLGTFITRPEVYHMDAASVADMLRDVSIGALGILGLILMLTFIGALAPAILQGKWVFAADQIKPKLERISPLAGFKRIFGKKALIEFLKNFIKILIVGSMASAVVLPYRHQLPALMTIDTMFWMRFAGKMCVRMIVATCLLLFLLSILDYLYQRFTFMKSQRMSKQEVKDEYKQQEGDPHQKQKIKQLRSERARKRMMANVPKADVVITNPTHYAVALRYDSANMSVPKVVAKGTDEVAAKIREIAQKHRIIMVRNPPLARVLYDTTDVDEEIPVEHYQAVAKVISYVYQLKGKKPKAPGKKGYDRGGKRK